MEEARGQNKLFQNASPLMCYYSSAIGQFLTLKNQSKNRLLHFCLKFKSARITLRVTKIRVVFYVHTPIVNLTVLSMEFPIRYSVPCIFQTDWNFYQIILTQTQGKSPNKSLIKKLQMSSEIKLLARTKVYY